MNAIEPATPPAKTISKATAMLFHIAKHSHSLRDVLGIELQDAGRITFLKMHRPWLVNHALNGTKLTFDPDKFAKTFNTCSTHERHMRIWLVNVWNPSYAQRKGWVFDYFEAMGGLDGENKDCIIKWMQHPVWP